MINTTRYEDSFGAAQSAFDNRIDAPDLSQAVTRSASSPLQLYSGEKAGFRQVDAAPRSLPKLIGKILLMPNGQENFSPVVFSQVDGVYEITMLDLPYDPRVGISDGIHFGLSAKAQTRAPGFGGHGASRGFEAGHFSAVLAASSNGGDGIANALKQSGDSATHSILKNGAVETMTGLNMLELPYKTRRLPQGIDRPLPVFWHPSLGNESEVMAADFPEATKLLLGAGVAAIGGKGIDRARRLVEDAVRGA